jgi:hypothetical protein
MLRFSDSYLHYTSLAQKYALASGSISKVAHRVPDGRLAAYLAPLANGGSARLYCPDVINGPGELIFSTRLRVRRDFSPLTTQLFGLFSPQNDGSECDHLSLCVRPDGHLEVLSSLYGSDVSDEPLEFGRDYFIEFKMFAWTRFNQGSFEGTATFDGLNPTWGGWIVTTHPVYPYFGGGVGYTGTLATRGAHFWDPNILDHSGNYAPATWDDETAENTTLTTVVGESSDLRVSVTPVAGSAVATQGHLTFEKDEGGGYTTIESVSLIGRTAQASWIYSPLAPCTFRVRLDTVILPVGSQFLIEIARAGLSEPRLGDHAVRCIFPADAGAHADFTPSGAATNHECVDEESPDEDTTYVSSATVGHKDTYVYSDLEKTTGTIAAALVWMRSKNVGGATNLRALARVNAAEGQSDADLTPTASYQYTPGTIELNPDTGVPFTPSEINDTEFGQVIV